MPSGLIFAIIVLVIYGVIRIILESAEAKKIKAAHDAYIAKETAKMTPEQRDKFIASLQLREESVKEENRLTYLHGVLSLVIICPHCHEKGVVRKKSAVRVTKNRVNSVAGKAISLGTNSEREVTQLYCGNCKMTWDA